MFHLDFVRSRSEYQNESTENVKTRVPKLVNSRFLAILWYFSIIIWKNYRYFEDDNDVCQHFTFQ